MRMQQSLSGVRSIALQGALDRIVKMRASAAAEGSSVACCADLRSIAIGLRSSVVIETTYGADRELEKRD